MEWNMDGYARTCFKKQSIIASASSFQLQLSKACRKTLWGEGDGGGGGEGDGEGGGEGG